MTKTLTVKDIVTAVGAAIQWIEPGTFTITKDEYGETVVFSFEQDGKLWGKYTVTPLGGQVRHSMNWFADDMTAYWAITGLIKAEIKQCQAASDLPTSGADGGQDKTKSAFSPEYRAKLRHDLATYFGREELRNLCFDLGIPHENFPELLDSMAREIIAHCERVDRISALMAKCKELRPNVSWDDMPASAEGDK